MRSADYKIWRRYVHVARTFRLLNLGDAKVEHLRPFAAVRPGDHDVVALQVAMHDALLMRGVQRSAYLTNDLNDLIESHRTFALDDFFQRAAVKVLHHQEHDAVFSFAEICNANSVRMRNARGRFGFPRKARHDDVVNGERRTQDFYRDSLVHQNVLAAINGAHATAFDQFFDKVFSGERLSHQRVIWVAQNRRIYGAERRRIRVFPETNRTNFHSIVFRFLVIGSVSDDIAASKDAAVTQAVSLRAQTNSLRYISSHDFEKKMRAKLESRARICFVWLRAVLTGGDRPDYRENHQ